MSLMAQREFNIDKSKNFSEWYNTVIYAADLVDGRYNVQGFVVHKPWVVKAFTKLYALFEAELEKDGHEKVIFPTVIPEENFEKEKEHVAGFVPQVFWITEAGGEKMSRKLALRPTSETAFYQMYALWLQSEADLPFKLYQSCSVFRFETETLPFIRGREFLWIETHDAFAEKQGAVAQVAKDVEIGRKVLGESLGIPLMVFARPHWDKFPGADETVAYDVLMPDGKVLQVGATHLLGQNFAKAFNIQFLKADGSKHFVWQTCFGPGIWRMMGACASVHGDSKGLIFPPAIAPVEVVIVPIFKDDNKTQVVDYANGLAVELKKAAVSALVDDREKTPGFKYNEWELKGVPLRIEVGGKELQQQTVTLVRRDSREKKTVAKSELIAETRKLEEEMLSQMRARAETSLNSRISDAETIDDIAKALEKGFARIGICSVAADGEACGKLIQDQTKGGKVRGRLFAQEEEPPFAKCAACGRPAKACGYVARQY